MLKAISDQLIGNKLKAILKEEDMVAISFEDGSRMSIFNKCSLSTTDSRMLDKRLLRLNETKESLTLIFEVGELSVDLSNDAWTGPEAIELILSNGQIIVWN